MEPKTTKKPSRKLVVFKRELPFYLMLIIFFPLPLTLPIPTFYFLIPNCSNFSPCFLTPNFSGGSQWPTLFYFPAMVRRGAMIWRCAA